MTTIRRIEVAEAPLVRALYAEAGAEAAEKHPDDNIAISAAGLDNLETSFRVGAVHQDVVTLVAEEDGELVGYVNAEITRSGSLPGLAGEIHELWTRAGNAEARRELAEEALRELRERGAGPIFHYEDVDHPDREPWTDLGFVPDTVRYALYRE